MTPEIAAALKDVKEALEWYAAVPFEGDEIPAKKALLSLTAIEFQLADAKPVAEALKDSIDILEYEASQGKSASVLPEVDLAAKALRAALQTPAVPLYRVNADGTSSMIECEQCAAVPAGVTVQILAQAVVDLRDRVGDWLDAEEAGQLLEKHSTAIAAAQEIVGKRGTECQ